jgi:hypothetical protein
MAAAKVGGAQTLGFLCIFVLFCNNDLIIDLKSIISILTFILHLAPQRRS